MSFINQNFSPCQKRAFKILTETKDNIFLTGSAGTGKSFLIREFLKGKERKTFPIVASTGAAAVIVGGRTFHSFFGLGIMEGGLEATVKKASNDRRVRNRLANIDGFILDEVSMIPGDAFQAAAAICRNVREYSEPWGGIRVIAVGDFAQLPPVGRSSSQRPWAFLDYAWEETNFTAVILETILRSKDEDYLAILRKIRQGIVDEDVKIYLERRTDRDQIDPTVTHLFPRRNMAEAFNKKRLDEVKKKLHEFPTLYSGSPMGIVSLKKQAPIPEILHLKESALVMIRVNDPALKYVNGSVGTIEDISNDNLVIGLKNGKHVDIEPTSFSILNADGKEVATATNFPVNLAYATTIHKAQGATLDQLVCDLEGLWEPGQAYVAMSRLRSGKGLTLTGWNESSIKVDPQVVQFHEEIFNQKTLEKENSES